MSRRFAFSPVLLIALAGLVAGALMLWFFAQTRDSGARDTLGPGANSHSAIGYAGLADILESMGVPVVKCESRSQSQGESGLLVIGEPSVGLEADATLRATMQQAPRILLILPKWYGRPQYYRHDWIEYAFERNTSDAQRALALALPYGEIRRVPKVDAWPTNVFRQTPQFKTPVQLVRSETMRPLIATSEGILLGEIRRGGQTIWVLSDPDIIANHGLGQGGEGNAVLAVEIVKFLRASRGKVIFDESIHGYGTKAAPPRVAMFKFPFSIVTVLGAMATVLLLWSTMGRFGAPERPPVPLAAGKQGLVENVARLMDFAGHHKLMLHRYVEATIQDTARQMHAPKGLESAELAKWLVRLGRVRGTSVDCAAVLARANELIRDKRSDTSAFVTIARDIYRWKQEIIDGPSRHKRDH